MTTSFKCFFDSEGPSWVTAYAPTFPEPPFSFEEIVCTSELWTASFTYLITSAEISLRDITRVILNNGLLRFYSMYTKVFNTEAQSPRGTIPKCQWSYQLDIAIMWATFFSDHPLI